MADEARKVPWKAPPTLYNGTIETTLRVLRVLDAMHPLALAPDEISFLDYAVVHTADFGGPASLHPANPGRRREVQVRRPLIEEALEYAVGLGLAERAPGDGPTRYLRTDEKGTWLLDEADTPYDEATRERAKWLAARHKGRPTRELARLAEGVRDVHDAFEFDEGDDTAATLRRFEALDRVFDSDIPRMESLQCAGAVLGIILSCQPPDGDAGGTLAAHAREIGAAAAAEVRKVRANKAGLAATMASLREDGGP